MILSEKLYQVLKWLALIALPALGTLYNGLSLVWGLPHGDAVLQTCSLLGVFIGVLIGVSQYCIGKEDKEPPDIGKEGTD